MVAFVAIEDDSVISGNRVEEHCKSNLMLSKRIRSLLGSWYISRQKLKGDRLINWMLISDPALARDVGR